MAAIEAIGNASGSWFDCLREFLQEVGWVDVTMEGVTRLSDAEVKDMLSSSALRVVSDCWHLL